LSDEFGDGRGELHVVELEVEALHVEVDGEHAVPLFPHAIDAAVAADVANVAAVEVGFHIDVQRLVGVEVEAALRGESALAQVVRPRARQLLCRGGHEGQDDRHEAEGESCHDAM